MFFFDKIFSVGAHTLLHILGAQQQRGSLGAATDTGWGFLGPWQGLEHKPSSPGSGVP